MQQQLKKTYPTGKKNPPNWENIFSQLGNYFFTVKCCLLVNKYTKASQLSFSLFFTNFIN